MRLTLSIALLGLFFAGIPEAKQANPSAFSRIDELVRDAIAAKATPGAVVLIGRGEQTLYEKAFGFRATVPAEEPMTLDTVFDLASLTKVVGTTTRRKVTVASPNNDRLEVEDATRSNKPSETTPNSAMPIRMRQRP